MWLQKKQILSYVIWGLHLQNYLKEIISRNISQIFLKKLRAIQEQSRFFFHVENSEAQKLCTGSYIEKSAT